MMVNCSLLLQPPSGKRRGRKPGLNSTIAQRSAANARERSRMRVLSGAFVELKGVLPWVPKDTKLSKLDTLKLAAGYIAYLRKILNSSEDAGGQSRSPGGSCLPETSAFSPLRLLNLVSQQHQSLGDTPGNQNDRGDRWLFSSSAFKDEEELEAGHSPQLTTDYSLGNRLLHSRLCLPFGDNQASFSDSEAEDTEEVSHTTDLPDVVYPPDLNSARVGDFSGSPGFSRLKCSSDPAPVTSRLCRGDPRGSDAGILGDLRRHERAGQTRQTFHDCLEDYKENNQISKTTDSCNESPYHRLMELTRNEAGGRSTSPILTIGHSEVNFLQQQASTPTGLTPASFLSNGTTAVASAEVPFSTERYTDLPGYYCMPLAHHFTAPFPSPSLQHSLSQVGTVNSSSISPGASFESTGKRVSLTDHSNQTFLESFLHFDSDPRLQQLRLPTSERW